MNAAQDAERLLRERVIATALGMNAAGINRARAGNVSARWSIASTWRAPAGRRSAR